MIPGRADQHVAAVDAESFGGGEGHCVGIGIAPRPRAGIGVAGIDDHRRGPSPIFRKARAIEHHRRRGKLVLREDGGAGHGLPVVGGEQRHVVAPPLHPGMAARGDEPFRGGDAHG
jgi:hypothetical protein